jgi:hypothetical protein
MFIEGAEKMQFLKINTDSLNRGGSSEAVTRGNLSLKALPRNGFNLAIF